MSKTVPVSRGGQLLLAALEVRELTLNRYSDARTIGAGDDKRPIGRGVLSRVIRGKRACSREIALACLEDFGIPIEAWDQKPLGRPRENSIAA